MSDELRAIKVRLTHGRERKGIKIVLSSRGANN